MLTGEIKSQVDKIWETFWTGGISNPLTVIEQFTYLLFIRRLDEIEQLEEKKASVAGKRSQKAFYGPNQQCFRWHSFRELEPQTMFNLFTQPQLEADGLTVFEHMKQLGDQAGVFAQYMKGATFMIPTPKVLDQVVQMINGIQMADRDTKGDLYEYLLSKIATAGTNGQFRTPRHIIKMMVEMMEPNREDTICDPACGTAGFLVASGEYIYQHHPDWLHDQTFREHFNSDMFTGIEFDSTMLRIAAMNLQLHAVERPNLIGQDALGEANAASRDQYSLILANPPFKGSLDYDGVESSLLKTVKTKKTELLFIALMLRMLKIGGRCAVIIPDGVLFGSSNAHKQLRQTLVEKQRLEAIISMPSGVFKPYAGVSTAVVIFTKTNNGGTDNVWFYDMHADGYSLDDKRSPIKNNDIDDIVQRFKQRDKEINRQRTDQSFMVPFDEIKQNDWDLSINRYKEVVYEQVEYDPPAKIIAEIEQLDNERGQALQILKELLG
ncbi:MAG TPA: SAM-dependent DNA methyltransferase [Methylophaga aminisulfidivorans]|uniref:type I restriction-modification system subunit M n=1 Tax=Methylophaga TaxID=40222 RepID=UPI0017657401|nr:MULTISPECIES: class I SAM-dependent DNA methyltransferase [Methylophaga]HIC47015.1 SAM-dependent DNA methyltransferase [Methylophaga sp.]HIM39595.1 SAM-dependent DNA methyltransferase [Methylophaga aminisulfidivorans]